MEAGVTGHGAPAAPQDTALPLHRRTPSFGAADTATVEGLVALWWHLTPLRLRALAPLRFRTLRPLRDLWWHLTPLRLRALAPLRLRTLRPLSHLCLWWHLVKRHLQRQRAPRGHQTKRLESKLRCVR